MFLVFMVNLENRFWRYIRGKFLAAVVLVLTSSDLFDLIKITLGSTKIKKRNKSARPIVPLES